ncbi:protein-ER retention protein (Erd1), putative [Metarhizium acridum CQMa 102]|uniref:Protein-ER retention protein (Erd1), putative n=1 Tax=Metarhizium acridum (strain CQMa 102) TaxID=655827 RepID=E9EE34_METAQ|nr:protein-ER retention protein (Erd1), putative [Metarhizium acridum CQMa 102]EFY85820.1 protein-ER retention protein (Erd1), putative [Metarhizium acridum CQMa 102]
MDGDPAVEPELDAFSLVFPLPYRVGFIATLGQFLVSRPERASESYKELNQTKTPSRLGMGPQPALLVPGQSRRPGVDTLPGPLLAAPHTAPLLDVPPRDRPLGPLRRVHGALLAVHAGGGVARNRLRLDTHDVPRRHRRRLPGPAEEPAQRREAAVPRDAEARQRRGHRGGAGRQVWRHSARRRADVCIVEYLRVRRAPYKESAGWGGQHLANALKYSTAFPVLVASALQRNTDDAAAKAAYNRAWLAAVLVNSLYSFYWDVAKDWDMTLFASRRERNSSHHPWGLRDRLIFRPVFMYYAVIVLDLMLRCTWSLKLSPHLDRFSDFESGIFLIELLEVFRRWVWIFFRVETEWIRNSSTGLGIDDILLGDYQGKDDDDE